MSVIDITAGGYTFKAQFEDGNAPKTCAKFRSLLPYRERIIHVRWSGEGCWIPLGDLDLGLPFENHQLPRPRPISAIPWRDFRNRDPASLRRRPVREQNGTAGRQPFLDRCGRQRKSGGPGPDGAVARRPRHRIQELLRLRRLVGHKPSQKIAGVRIAQRNRLHIPL